MGDHGTQCMPTPLSPGALMSCCQPLVRPAPLPLVCPRCFAGLVAGWRVCLHCLFLKSIMVQVNGHLGVISERKPSTMTSYFAPAVLGFVTETTDLFVKNRTDFISTRFLDGSGALSAPQLSYGGQKTRIFGMHFGRKDLAKGVRAWCD
jgi:hypothetical protein